jgi:predicted membrane chloride channel (bestrophin family)
MFSSGVIRGLGLEIGSVFFVALVVFLTNLAISSGALVPLGITSKMLLRLPVLPFTLSSPALSLLLVFRTNTVYR